MEPHLHDSWLVLDQAIGDDRVPLAELLHCSIDTLDLQCSPPPDFTPRDRKSRGRRNWLDEAYFTAKRCTNGMAAIHFLCKQLGGTFLPDANLPHPDEGRLLVEPAGLADGIKVILRELNRTPAKAAIPEPVLADLVAAFCRDLRALHLDRRNRRRKGADR